MREIQFAVALTTPDFGEIGDIQGEKERTQTNPLRLTFLDSSIYAVSERNEPIEVNPLVSNGLEGEKARFPRKMNEAQVTAPNVQEIGGGKSKFKNRKSGLDCRLRGNDTKAAFCWIGEL